MEDDTSPWVKKKRLLERFTRSQIESKEFPPYYKPPCIECGEPLYHPIIEEPWGNHMVKIRPDWHCGKCDKRFRVYIHSSSTECYDHPERPWDWGKSFVVSTDLDCILGYIEVKLDKNGLTNGQRAAKNQYEASRMPDIPPYCMVPQYNREHMLIPRDFHEWYVAFSNKLRSSFDD